MGGAMGRLIGVLLLVGCSGNETREAGQCPEIEALGDTPEILAIGDSIFAWREKRCATIPDVVAEGLQRRVLNVAVNASRIRGGDTPIEEQYAPDAYDWVILDGGGNDLNARCECLEGCDDVLDDLASEDGATGAIPELVDQILADGSRVLLYGYYEVDDRGWYGLGACGEEVDELRSRQATVAATRVGVTFVDGRDAVTVDMGEAYAFDHVHPSREGARRVGELVVEAILEAEE